MDPHVTSPMVSRSGRRGKVKEKGQHITGKVGYGKDKASIRIMMALIKFMTSCGAKLVLFRLILLVNSVIQKTLAMFIY